MRIPTRFRRHLSPSSLFLSVTFLVIATVLIQGLLYLAKADTNRQRVLAHVRSATRSTSYLGDVQNSPASGATTHIGFLKVHKAASTTTQAMFLRFGWKRNLTFVLPPEYNIFQYPNIISMFESITQTNTLQPPKNKAFDVLCHHVVYNKDAWAQVLPYDSVIIGTVREPTALLTSMLNYMNPGYISRIPSNDTLSTFLQRPGEYEPTEVCKSVTNNRMAFEYGVHPDIIKHRDIDAFQEYLAVLDKEFKLVIVAERYDESLILLKRYLNWTMDEILYVSKNVRNVQKPARYPFDYTFLHLYKNHSLFDYMLYDFFLQKINDQILDEGSSFIVELAQFREIRDFVETFCHTVAKSVSSVTVRKSKWNSAFDITREDCELLHTGEIKFTQNIRRRQYGNATWTHAH